jgi:hypothetical protein
LTSKLRKVVELGLKREMLSRKYIILRKFRNRRILIPKEPCFLFVSHNKHLIRDGGFYLCYVEHNRDTAFVTELEEA